MTVEPRDTLEIPRDIPRVPQVPGAPRGIPLYPGVPPGVVKWWHVAKPLKYCMEWGISIHLRILQVNNFLMGISMLKHVSKINHPRREEGAIF